MRSTAILISFLSFFGVHAQEVISAKPALSEYDSVRAYYINHFPDYFFVYPVLRQRSLNFELEKLKDDQSVITYKPNSSYSFGLGVYLFELGAELAFAVPLEEQSITRFGKSRARDVQLNVLGKKWGVDAFYQKYNGFYITDSNTEIPDGEVYPQRPDIVSRNIGLTGNYVFNNQKFSFRSAYNFAERQVFSKGSFVVFSGISGFKVEADSSILDNAQRAVFGNDVAFKKLSYLTLSMAPGYTYSIVFKSFFLNAMLSVGPAHHWIAYQRDGETDRKDTALNSFVAARIGLGYNGQRIFGGISFLTQGSNVKFEDVRFSNNNGTFKILLGYRFNEFGFLKKRVWDLLPFKI
jgi:hypothetical protein